MNQKRRRRISKFEKKARRNFIIVAFVCIMTIIGLNSIENALNINVQKVEYEIETLKADLDGLNTELASKISFENITAIAAKKGYTLNYSTATAVTTPTATSSSANGQAAD